MALVELNKNPSRRDLWVFGIGLPLVGAILGASGWRRGHVTSAVVLWIAAAALLAAFLALPKGRRHLYVGWMYLVFPIAFTVSHAILAVLYFGVLTPVAFLMRFFGRDPMQRRFDRAATTYWVEHPPERDMERYFRQW